MSVSTSAGGSIVHFKIHYRSQFGQELIVCGDGPYLGANSIDSALKLRWDNDYWTGCIGIPKEDVSKAISYKYGLRNPDGSVTWEHGERRLIPITREGFIDKTVELRETWRVCALKS